MNAPPVESSPDTAWVGAAAATPTADPSIMGLVAHQLEGFTKTEFLLLAMLVGLITLLVMGGRKILPLAVRLWRDSNEVISSIGATFESLEAHVTSSNSAINETLRKIVKYISSMRVEQKEAAKEITDRLDSIERRDKKDGG
jgi:hypothetical protein